MCAQFLFCFIAFMVLSDTLYLAAMFINFIFLSMSFFISRTCSSFSLAVPHLLPLLLVLCFILSIWFSFAVPKYK